MCVPGPPLKCPVRDDGAFARGRTSEGDAANEGIGSVGPGSVSVETRHHLGVGCTCAGVGGRRNSVPPPQF